MKIINKTLSLPEGDFSTEVQIFEESDRKVLKEIYINWRNLCSNLNAMEARSVNLPEGLSEGAFCLEMQVVRITNSISGANTSYDCYSLDTNKRIQVKACSVLPDLTSFGPRSVWDEIYFCDFYKSGKWDGEFDIYLIDNELIYNHMVNATQTMREQQLEGRRPRFSIFKELITNLNIQPVKTGRLF